METPLRVCVVCGQAFWPAEGAAATPACPSCSEVEASEEPLRWREEREESGSMGEAQSRFVALSALPEEKRMPRRSHGLIVPRRLMARELAVSPVAAPLPITPVRPRPNSAMVSVRQLAFNCPACFMVLIIKDPQHYDGRAAPCPSCRAVILPPRVAPPSPFTMITAPEPASTSIPPQPKQSRWMRFERRAEAIPACQQENLTRAGAA